MEEIRLGTIGSGVIVHSILDEKTNFIYNATPDLLHYEQGETEILIKK